MSDLNKKSYAAIAETWAATRNKSFVSATVKDFASRLPKNAVVLDIGCGTGLPNGKFLMEEGFEYVGIDQVAQMVDLCKSNLGNEAQIYNVSFEDCTSEDLYDGILAYDILFHLQYDQQIGSFQKMSSMLKKKGFLHYTHGYVDGEHVDTMMGKEFYYSCIPFENQKILMEQAGLEVLWYKKDYIERDMDRGLVVLAQKLS